MMFEFMKHLWLCVVFPWYNVHNLVMEGKISSVFHFKTNAYLLESCQSCTPAALFLKYSA